MCNSTIGFGSIRLSNTPVVLGIATASTFHCISSSALPFYSWSICRVSLCALRSIVFITLKHPSALVRATASTFHCATLCYPQKPQRLSLPPSFTVFPTLSLTFLHLEELLPLCASQFIVFMTLQYTRGPSHHYRLHISLCFQLSIPFLLFEELLLLCFTAHCACNF